MYATCVRVAAVHIHTTEFTSTAIMHNTSLSSDHSNLTPISTGNI